MTLESMYFYILIAKLKSNVTKLFKIMHGKIFDTLKISKGVLKVGDKDVFI